MGFVLRNHTGTFIATGSINYTASSAEEGEARGLLQALLWSRSLDFGDILLETDCKSITYYMQGLPSNISRVSRSILDDAKELIPSFDFFCYYVCI